MLTGPLTLMPAMTFYMTAGPLLGLIVLGVIVYFRPQHLSRKPAAELPLQAA